MALFILLHGVGGSPADMAPLGAAIRARLPAATVVAPAGLDAFDLAPRGRQWFSVDGVTDANRPARVAAAAPRLAALVRQLQREAGATPQDTVLVGFSQGAIMALETAQAGGIAAHVVGLSGRFAELPAAWPADTSVHLVHGRQDGVIAAQHSVQAAERLRRLGARVRCDLLADGGHSVSADAIRAAVDALALPA